jgi:chemotaxis protein MotB
MAKLTRKKKILEDVSNHERWMVSYADFITLLFAFFVVMYSISSVNEGKYKSLTSSLGNAFSNAAKPVPELIHDLVETPLIVEEKILTDIPSIIYSPIPLDNPMVVFNPILNPIDAQITEDSDQRRELSAGILKERQQLKKVSEQLEKALGIFIGDNLISVKRNDYWIALEMNSELLFLSGDAILSKKAQPVLKKIVEVINSLPNVINVEGHTDNIPIGTVKFPSNWDLSSARATTVVQEFVKEGINPTRLSAIGYGEFHPIDDNTTEEGRFKNRRVILVLMSQAFARYGANDEERAKLLNLAPSAINYNQPIKK